MNEEAITAVLHIKTDVADVKNATEQIKGIADTAGKSASNIKNTFEKSAQESASSIDETMKKLEELSKQNISVQPFRLNFDDLQKQCEKIADAGDEALNKLNQSSAKNNAEIEKLTQKYVILEKTIQATGNNPDAAQTQRLANLKLEIKRRQELGQEITKQYNLVKNTGLDGQIKLIQQALEKMSKAGLEGTDAFKKLSAKMKEMSANKSVIPDNKKLEDYTESIYDATIGQTKFGASLKNLVLSGKGVSGIFDKMGIAAKSLGKTLLGLMANPVFLAIAGVAAAGAAFKWWFDYNKGVEQATRLTQQFTGLEGQDLKNFRIEVQGVADTFGKDFEEVLEATNAMSKQMGISFDEALAAVKDGFVLGADANGEYLDTLKEYPAYFKEAGLSAKQFVAITAKGVQEGVFSDKAVDTIKEANLRLREMPTATQQAIDGIGLSSKAMMDALKNNEITTFQAMQQISAKMAELPAQSSEVGTAIADIFGGPGEDAGLQFIESLATINGDLETMKSNAGTLAGLQDDLVESNTELNKKISEVFDSTGGVFETLETNAKIFLNDVLIDILDGIETLYNWFVDFWNEGGMIKTLIIEVGVIFKNVFQTIWQLIKTVSKELHGMGDILVGIFTFDTDKISKGFNECMDATSEYVNGMKDIWSDTFDDIEKGVNSKLEHIGKDTTQAMNDITKSTDGVLKYLNARIEKANAQKAKIQKYAEINNKFDENTKWIDEQIAAQSKGGGSDKAADTYIEKLQKKLQAAQKKLQAVNPLKTDSKEIEKRKEAVKALDEEIKKYNALVAIESTLDKYQRQRNEAQDALVKLVDTGASEEEINKQKEIIKALDEEKAAYEDKLSLASEYEKLTSQISKEQEKLAKMSLDATDQEIQAQQEVIQKLENKKEARDKALSLNSFSGQLKAYEDYSNEVLKIEQDRKKKIQAINEDKDLSSEGKTQKIASVNKFADMSIQQLIPEDITEEQAQEISASVANQMSAIVGMTAEELNKKIIELKKQIQELKKSGVSASDAEELTELENNLTITTEAFENLQTKEDKTISKSEKNGKKWNKFMAYFSGASDILKNVTNDLDCLSDDAKSTINDMLEIADAGMTMITNIGTLTNTTVESEEVTAETSATAISTVEKASVILAVISAAIQIAMKIINLFKKKKEKEAQEKIEAIEEQVESLQDAYDELGEKIDNAYSTDATKLIAQQDELLKQQRALLVAEINEEKKKKKTDEDRVKELQDEIAEIDKTLANRDSDIVTAMLGKDYSSVLDDFSSEVMSAMDDAETSVDDAVKNISKSIKKAAIQQQLNSKLQPLTEEYAKSLSDAMVDGVISETENATLQGLENSISDISEDYLSQFDDLWDTAEAEREAVSGGVSSMSQDTAEEMNGRLTQIQSHTFSINENVKALSDFASSQLEVLQGINADTNKIVEGIEHTNAVLDDMIIRGVKIK